MDSESAHERLVCDYLKNFLSRIRNIFGGEMKSYRTLMVRARREALLRIVEQAVHEVGAEEVIHIPNVALVAIFGPDFRERPNIAGTFFSALAQAGINILAISTSISTLSCVIDADRLDDAVRAICGAFELP